MKEQNEKIHPEEKIKIIKKKRQKKKTLENPRGVINFLRKGGGISKQDSLKKKKKPLT